MNGTGPGKICVSAHTYFQFGCLSIATLLTIANEKSIDKDIDTYRKADGSFKTGKIKKGTKVRIVQKKSSFVFGASAFNWGQLGSEASNKRYQELFGGLFNRATVPFYWKDFEIKPGNPRFATSLIDTEVFWNKVESPMRQPQMALSGVAAVCGHTGKGAKGP